MQGASESVDFSFSDKGWTHVDEGVALATSSSGVDDASKEPLSIVISDEEDVKDEPSNDLAGSEIDVSSSSSSGCEGLGCTSSSSDEEAGAECPSQRMVRVPTTPAGFSLVQHSKLKTLHLLENGFEKVLACGRSISSMHKSIDLSVRWDTPCCHNCWKKVGLGRARLQSRSLQFQVGILLCSISKQCFADVICGPWKKVLGVLRVMETSTMHSARQFPKCCL